jgi:hypothetical protein
VPGRVYGRGVQPVFHRTREFLVECFVPGVDRRDVEAAAARVRAATHDQRAAGAAIEYLGAILLSSDEVVLHRFRADSPAVVRAACEGAEIALERVTEAVTVAGGEALDPVTTGSREDTPA